MKLKGILDRLNLTLYGTAQLIGAETDEPIQTVYKRWQRWLEDPPKTIELLERDLQLLGEVTGCSITIDIQITEEKSSGPKSGGRSSASQLCSGDKRNQGDESGRT